MNIVQKVSLSGQRAISISSRSSITRILNHVLPANFHERWTDRQRIPRRLSHRGGIHLQHRHSRNIVIPATSSFPRRRRLCRDWKTREEVTVPILHPRLPRPLSRQSTWCRVHAGHREEMNSTHHPSLPAFAGIRGALHGEASGMSGTA